MQTAAIPSDEAGRIAALHSLNILDTEPEERFDRLTRIARRMFAVPIAVVSLIDTNRQWFKSSVGLSVCETSRDISFCAHAILSDEILQIEDALQDERFFDNPLVAGDPRIRFYAGCPLRVGNQKMGTFCLIDQKPRKLSEDEREMLRDLAEMAEQNLAAEQLAVTDALTGLTNRRGFEAFARKVLGVCRRLNKPATLVYFDLNMFKQINDTYGHAEGDRTLKAFADCLLSAFRESDAVARLGGDEFAVLLADASLAAAGQAIARLRSAIEEANQQSGARRIEFSSGEIAFDPTRHDSIEALLLDADAAMYAEKLRSRSQ